MPFLDVSDLLSDPDLAQTFSVVRKADAVNADGVNTGGTTTVNGVVGVILPIDDVTLTRLADGSRLAETIEIYTTFKLTAGTATTGADVVLHQGRSYTVTDLTDYTFFADCVRALAQLRELN